MHINADLYETKEELIELSDELREMKNSVSRDEGVTLDYAISLIDEIIDEAD